MADGPGVSDPAPRFELVDDSGTAWSLDAQLCDGRTRPIVLVFHRHIH